MPTTEGTPFDCILWVSLFFSTFTTKSYNISPSIIPAMNCLEVVDALAGVLMTYACNGIMGCALGEGTERKRRKSCQGKRGRGHRADIFQEGYQRRRRP